MYLANPSTQAVRDAMRSNPHLGYIDTPKQGNKPVPGLPWCADNGCFGKGYPGDEAWLEWLARLPNRETCLFATAPDVVGDAAATLERSAPWLQPIRDLDYKAALVAQDGLEDLDVPWDTFDVLFIGGTTEWKLGPAAAGLIAEAKARGKWVHVGRVNSRKRFRRFLHLGADSVDGTFLAFGPDTNLPRLMRWLNDNAQASVFDLIEGDQ